MSGPNTTVKNLNMILKNPILLSGHFLPKWVSHHIH